MQCQLFGGMVNLIYFHIKFGPKSLTLGQEANDLLNLLVQDFRMMILKKTFLVNPLHMYISLNFRSFVYPCSIAYVLTILSMGGHKGGGDFARIF